MNKLDIKSGLKTGLALGSGSIRRRPAGDPPDILLSPKLSHIGLLEIYRAREAILEGEKCVQRMASEIAHVVETG